MEESFYFTLESIGNIPTLNQYLSVTRTGKRVLTPAIRKYKQLVTKEMLTVISRVNFKKRYRLLTDITKSLTLRIDVFLSVGFKVRDLSNTLKHTEDAIYDYLDLNDKRNTRILLSKKPSLKRCDYLEVCIELNSDVDDW